MRSNPRTESAALRPGPGETFLPARVNLETGGLEALNATAGEWRRLCDEASNDEPFYRPEWIRANVHAFAPEARLVLFKCHAGGGLTGVLPLISERGFFCGLPVRRLRSASNVHSCRFDLLRARGPAGDAAVAAIWERLKALSGWDVLQLGDVPEDGALMDLGALASRDGYPIGRWESMRSLWIPLPRLAAAGGEPWLTRPNAKFRGELRRTSRRLAEKGEIGLRRIPAADEQWLQTFYRLEHSGWKGAAGTAIDCNRATKTFYDEAASEGAGFGYLSLYFLECAGRPIAGQYGLMYRDRYFVPKLAMDESYKPYGPGHLLIEAVVRHCVERGVTVYDFTGPWAEYKAQWTGTIRRHYWLWIFRRSPYGRLLHHTRFSLLAGIKRTLGRVRAAPAPR